MPKRDRCTHKPCAYIFARLPWWCLNNKNPSQELSVSAHVTNLSNPCAPCAFHPLDIYCTRISRVITKAATSPSCCFVDYRFAIYIPSWVQLKISPGNQAELVQSEAGMANRRWKESFGDVYRFKSCFGVNIVCGVCAPEIDSTLGWMADAQRRQGYCICLTRPNYNLSLGRVIARVSSNGHWLVISQETDCLAHFI